MTHQPTDQQPQATPYQCLALVPGWCGTGQGTLTAVTKGERMGKPLDIDSHVTPALGRRHREMTAPTSMTRPTSRLASGVCVLAVGVGLFAVPSHGTVTADGERAVSAKQGPYKPPKAGPWHFKDSFGDSSGTFRVKAGKRGKPAKVTKLRFQILAQDNGAFCPAPGETVTVNGTFSLRKGIKFSDHDVTGSPWITAVKDAPASGTHPNLEYMKPIDTTAKVGADTRFAQVAMRFNQEQANKPHEVSIGMRLAPPGIKDLSEGWCIFNGRGKPGKG